MNREQSLSPTIILVRIRMSSQRRQSSQTKRLAYAEQQKDWEELERLKGNRPLRGFATHREANTPSA